MTTVRTSVIAPAKLNLLLAVGPKRSDGYHEIVSVMQTLDLADRIDIDVDVMSTTDIDVLVEAHDVPGGDTLVTRAVTALLKRMGRGARIWVTIEKEIPIGGGLGGGSSDAAAALRAVHDLLGAPLSEGELHQVAAHIGSDVPFFLLGPETTAYATGRGEIVEPIDPITPRSWLLAFPRVHQSTATVYERFDPATVEPLPHDAAIARRLARGRNGLRNDLTDAARDSCAELNHLVQALEDAGGVPLICGSGASVAVPLTSHEERRAYENVAQTAVPGCWTRVAWTTVADH